MIDARLCVKRDCKQYLVVVSDLQLPTKVCERPIREAEVPQH